MKIFCVEGVKGEDGVFGLNAPYRGGKGMNPSGIRSPAANVIKVAKNTIPVFIFTLLNTVNCI